MTNKQIDQLMKDVSKIWNMLVASKCSEERSREGVVMQEWWRYTFRKGHQERFYKVTYKQV